MQNKFVQITPDLNISQIITDEEIFVKPEDYSDRAYIQTLINTSTNADSNLLDGHARVSNFVMPEKVNEPLYLQEPDRRDELDEINFMNTDALVSLRTIEPIENKIQPIEDAIIDIPEEKIIIIEEPKIEKLKFGGAAEETPAVGVSPSRAAEETAAVGVSPSRAAEETPTKKERPKKERLSSKQQYQQEEERGAGGGREVPADFRRMTVSELAPYYQGLINEKAKTYTTAEGATIVKVGSEKITRTKMISALESNI